MPREGDLWEGYRVSLPGQDRKYHVKRHRGRWTVKVWYRPVGRYAYAWRSTATDCSELVAAVNRVARRFHRKPGGSFYFNEFNQVLKPIYGDGRVELRYVGDFPGCLLRFQLLDGVWNNRPPHTPDRELAVGDNWVGPRCGIPYWIETGRELRIYRPSVLQSEDDFVEVRHREYLDPYNRDYGDLAQAVWKAKGRSGGRFYVTESGSLWAPYWEGPGRTDWNYRYVGRLWEYVEGNEWYPKCA